MYVIPEFLYPRNPYILISSVILAHIFEYIYPFHKGVLLTLHPVHTSYILAMKIGKKYSSKIRGVVTWFIIVLSHLLLYGFILYISWMINPLLWIIIAGWIIKLSFSLKLLTSIIENISKCSYLNDWNCVRFWTQQIVRRNVYAIDEEHVLSAAIESLVESLVDGYTSPLFYILLFGPLGALLQRIANTLDGALGFKTTEYKDVGWFSAKADTILNYIPARLTAITIVILSPFVKASISYAYKIWRKHHRVTESLNAGHPMSAIAGVMMIRLEKIGDYTIGEKVRVIDYSVVRTCLKISKTVAIIWLLVINILIYILSNNCFNALTSFSLSSLSLIDTLPWNFVK
jgi:adenosylcobinamide-phosphate synthase